MNKTRIFLLYMVQSNLNLFRQPKDPSMYTFYYTAGVVCVCESLPAIQIIDVKI